MQLDRLLSRLGFRETRPKVYLATLESGPSSAQELAERSDLPRTTVYSVLDYLARRGR